MRILYVGDFSEKSRGGNYYQISRRLTNGFIRNGHDVLPFSIRFMAKELGIIKSGKWGAKLANARLPAFLKTYQPDILLHHHATLLDEDVVAQLRQAFPALRVGMINVDPIFDDGNVARMQAKAGITDATFVTTGGAALAKTARKGAVAAFMPNPVDAAMERGRSFDHDDLPFDLFYGLGGPANDPHRIGTPEVIKQRLPDLRFSLHSRALGNTLEGQAYMDQICRAKMGLNLSRRKTGDRVGADEERIYYTSDRIAHYTGNGLMIFNRTGDQIESLFTPDEEAVFWENEDQLIEQIDRYAKDDAARRAIAKAGWQRAHEQYNERQVARFIELVLMERPVPDAMFGWDTTLWDGTHTA